MPPIRCFKVRVTIEGEVEAGNAGHAIVLLSQFMRSGIGDDDKTRLYNTVITDSEASFIRLGKDG